MIVPPMIRQIPFWYFRWYNSIMLAFNDHFHLPDLSGVVVLPSFPDPLYDTDCVHFTADCGPRYILVFAVVTLSIFKDFTVVARHSDLMPFVLSFILILLSQLVSSGSKD
jgi:hypothetical protein